MPESSDGFPYDAIPFLLAEIARSDLPKAENDNQRGAMRFMLYFLERIYERDGKNPYWAWRTYLTARALGEPIPEWVLEYLDRAADGIWKASKRAPKWIEGKIGRGIIRSKRVGRKNTPRKSIGPVKGALKYVLKGVSERSASLMGIERANQGSVMGKRVGTSQNIGPFARNAYAQEKWAERLVRARDHIDRANRVAPSSVGNVCNNAFADDLDIPDFLRRTKVTS